MNALVFAAALSLAAPPGTLDEKIAAALKNHPDVKAAEAKRLLAEAEVEQAKLSVAQKVTSALSRVELAKAKLMQAEADAAANEMVQKLPAASQLEKAQYAKAVPALAAARAEMAAAELELQQLIGPVAKPADKPEPSIKDVPTAKLPTGPAIDKLEAAVVKLVKLNLKDTDRPTAFKALLKAGGLESVTLRGENYLNAGRLSPPPIGNVTGEQSFSAWVEQFMDEFHGNDGPGVKVDVYVREYGLLIERVENAPKDAITLTEFARAVRAKK